jgi:hypothetical protein
MMNRWFLSVLLLGILTVGAVPAWADTDASDSVYVVQDLKGDVMILKNGKDRSTVLQEGDEVESGDEIQVGHDGEATLTLGDDQVIRLESDTKVKLSEAEPNKDGGFLTRLQLSAGNLLAEVKHLLEKKSKFEVESGGMICGVRGTIFEVSNEDGEVGAQTHEGVVACSSGSGVEERVKAGQGATFKNRRLLRRMALGKAGQERLAQWRQFRQVIGEMRAARKAGKIREFRRDRLEKIREQLRKRAAKRKHRVPPPALRRR